MLRDDLHVYREYPWEQSDRGSHPEDGATPDQNESDGGSSGRQRPLGRHVWSLLHHLESIFIVRRQPVLRSSRFDSRHADYTVDVHGI